MEQVSVIIPTYNRAHLLEPAIRSVINQTLPDWELLIVDDGSTDNTPAVVEKYLDDSRIKYIQKKNSGAGHSRNVGVAHASHSIITFLDSDDEAEPVWLEKMRHEIVHGQADIVCCGLSRYDSDGKLIDTKMPHKLSTLFNGITGKFTNGGSFMLKRSIFEAIGGYDPALPSGQHTELAMRLVPYVEEQGLKITNLQESLLRIHVHGGARIRTNYKAKYLGSSYTYRKHYNLFKKSKNAKSRYEGIIAYSAYRLGYMKEARQFAWKSFATKPTVIDFLRFAKYLFTLRRSPKPSS